MLKNVPCTCLNLNYLLYKQVRNSLSNQLSRWFIIYILTTENDIKILTHSRTVFVVTIYCT